MREDVVRRHGGQPIVCGGCDRRRAMDRKLAERNLTAGLLAAGLALLCFGLSFFLAVFYIT